MMFDFVHLYIQNCSIGVLINPLRVRVRVRGVRSHIHTTLRVIGFGLVWRRDDLP